MSEIAVELLDMVRNASSDITQLSWGLHGRGARLHCGPAMQSEHATVCCRTPTAGRQRSGGGPGWMKW